MFNPFPNKPWFLRVCITRLLKTLWEKEKLLVTSNFSFSHSVFHTLEELSSIFIKFEIVVCNLFQFGRVQNMSFGKGLIRLCHYTFQQLIIVIMTRLIPLSRLSIFSMMVIQESSQWLGKSVVQRTGKENPRKAVRCTGRHDIIEISLITIKSITFDLTNSKPCPGG